MKSKIKNIFLFIIMLILIASIAIFGIAIYMDVTKVDTSSINYYVDFNEENNDREQKTANADSTYIETSGNYISTNTITENSANNVVESNFYYNQLTDTQKKIYDGLIQNKDNMTDGTYVVEYGEAFSDILEQEGGNEQLGDDYQAAVEAFLYDNPDVFYMDVNKLYLNVKSKKKVFSTTYNVYVGPAENSNYFAEGFTSKAQVQDAKRKIENIKNSILQNVTGDTYKDILYIHDYLVENIDYDQDYSSIGSYSMYGALIDKECVCEGYAKTLKYLLNAANIPCEIIQGQATSSSGKTESHAWNIVYLEGKWYYIDATWDDPIIIGEGTVAKSVQYQYFLKGSDDMSGDHTLFYQFSDGGRTFRYPEASEENYE